MKQFKGYFSQTFIAPISRLKKGCWCCIYIYFLKKKINSGLFYMTDQIWLEFQCIGSASGMNMKFKKITFHCTKNHRYIIGQILIMQVSSYINWTIIVWQNVWASDLSCSLILWCFNYGGDDPQLFQPFCQWRFWQTKTKAMDHSSNFITWYPIKFSKIILSVEHLKYLR